MPDEAIDESDTSHIHMRVKTSKKNKWENHAEENGFGTLTRLITQSVDNTISDEWVLASRTDVSFDLEPIEAELSKLGNKIDSLQSQLDDIESPGSVDDERLPRDELMTIANRAHDIIPVARNDEDMRIIAESAHIIDEPRGRITGTAADVAEEIDEGVFATRQALIWLEREQNVPVTSFIDEHGVRRWYEIDPDLDVSAYPDEVQDKPEFRDASEL